MYREALKLPKAQTPGYLSTFCLRIIHQVLMKLVECYVNLQIKHQVCYFSSLNLLTRRLRILACEVLIMKTEKRVG